MMDKPRTPASTLIRAREIAINNGVLYAYTGNVHNEAGDSTYCHQCGNKLIVRDWYVLGAWSLDKNGCCDNCGAQCSGVFEEQPGAWGAKRVPVRLAE